MDSEESQPSTSGLSLASQSSLNGSSSRAADPAGRAAQKRSFVPVGNLGEQSVSDPSRQMSSMEPVSKARRKHKTHLKTSHEDMGQQCEASPSTSGVRLRTKSSEEASEDQVSMSETEESTQNRDSSSNILENRVNTSTTTSEEVVDGDLSRQPTSSLGPMTKMKNKHKTVQSSTTGHRHGPEHQVSADVSDSTNIFYMNNSTCIVQQGVQQNTPLQNILDSTQQLILHVDSAKHVSTFAERSALKMLKRFGSIFIKGRSGTGKSRIGLRLISEISRGKNCKPLRITSSSDWNLIPKAGEKYVVMMDDIFGSSNLVQSQVDEWARMFDIMWPSVESGQIILVITSRPEISAQCVHKMNKYDLMKKIPSVTLDEGEFLLRPAEKEKILRKFCSKKTNFSDKDIIMIKQIHTSLGFPQCCEFFANSKRAQVKGVDFFEKPYDCLMEFISSLKESDPLGCFVLQLVMLSKGCLKHELLKAFHQSPEFTKLVHDLGHSSNMSSVPTIGQIKNKIDSLCGMFLCQNLKGYQFQHQSVFDAVFLDMAEDYPEVCIQACPIKMLVKLVRLEDHQIENHEVVIHLKQDMYDVLADRFTEILQSEYAICLWNHPCLSDETFLEKMMSKWNHDTVKAVMTFRPVYCQSLQSLLDYAMIQNKHLAKHLLCKMDNIQYDFINITILELSIFLLKNEHVSQRLLCKMDTIHYDYTTSNILQLSISENLSGLTNILLDRGLHLNMGCLEALCSSKQLDFTVTERILKMLKLQHVTISQQNVPDLLPDAALNGNMPIVDMLLDDVLGDNVDVAFNCLLALQCKVKQERFHNHNSTVQIVTNKLLLFDFDEHKLDQLADISSEQHDAATLEAIMDKKLEHTPSDMIKYLNKALEDGRYGCVKVLIEYMSKTAEITDALQDFLFRAVITDTESVPKVKLILKTFEHLICSRDKWNKNSLGACDILRTAILFKNEEAVKLLITKAICVNVTNDTGVTPLHIATDLSLSNCVTELLHAGAEVNMKDKNSKSAVLFADNLDIIKKLVEAGGQVNDEDRNGKTALLKAVKRNNIDVVKFLFSRKSDVNHSDVQGHNVLHLAAQFGNVEMIEYLHEQGAIPTLDTKNKSVVQYAVESETDAVENLQYLVDILHVPVDVEDNRGRTALFPAVQSGDVEVVEFLVAKGANLKHRDKEGNTLLHAACEIIVSCEIVTFLCDAGIDTGLCNNRLETALYLSLLSYNRKQTQMFIPRSGKLRRQRQMFIPRSGKLRRHTNYCDLFRESLLAEEANRYTHVQLPLSPRSDCVELLLEKGADININQGDIDGITSLHLAAKTSLCYVKLLLDKGANRNITDKYGRKPAQMSSFGTVIFDKC